MYLSISPSLSPFSMEAERERGRADCCGLKCQRVMGFPAGRFHRLRRASVARVRRTTTHVVQPQDFKKKSKFSSLHTHTFLLPPVTHTDTHTDTHTFRCFFNQRSCVLSKAVKWFSGPVLAGFDESNTPLSPGSFYLPTKALTDGRWTVIGRCNCTCFTCASAQAHMDTFKYIFTDHGREEYKAKGICAAVENGLSCSIQLFWK